MGQALPTEPERRWTHAEFHAWQARQDERYELVDGHPVRMMSGTSMAHERVAVNILGEFLNQTRDGPCEPFGGGVSIETLTGNLRRPDVGIDCGDTDDEGYVVSDPRVVVEVFSRTTRWFDSMMKLPEYQAIEGLTHILYVEPTAMEVLHWWRDDARRWQPTIHTDPDDVIELTDVDVRLRLGDIYRRVRIDAPSA